MLSADEKPGVQCRMRIHLPLPAGPGRALRVESEYRRHGTLAYLAACDVRRARVFGRCEQATGIKPFTALVDQVMTAEPYASAKRVFWVVDNGSSHRNWAAADRLTSAYPNAHMVHLAVHASWIGSLEPVSPLRALDKLTWSLGGGSTGAAAEVRDPCHIIRRLGIRSPTGTVKHNG